RRAGIRLPRACTAPRPGAGSRFWEDRKSTRLNSSHVSISYAVFCLKKKITVFKITLDKELNTSSNATGCVLELVNLGKIIDERRWTSFAKIGKEEPLGPTTKPARIAVTGVP